MQINDNDTEEAVIAAAAGVLLLPLSVNEAEIYGSATYVIRRRLAG